MARPRPRPAVPASEPAVERVVRLLRRVVESARSVSELVREVSMSVERLSGMVRFDPPEAAAAAIRAHAAGRALRVVGAPFKVGGQTLKKVIDGQPVRGDAAFRIHTGLALGPGVRVVPAEARPADADAAERVTAAATLLDRSVLTFPPEVLDTLLAKGLADQLMELVRVQLEKAADLRTLEESNRSKEALARIRADARGRDLDTVLRRVREADPAGFAAWVQANLVPLTAADPA